MFIFIESMIWFLLWFIDSSYLKYLSIMICFIYCLKKGYGYGAFMIVLIADYFLLWTYDYALGVLIFICLQCYYHLLFSQSFSFYIVLILIVFPYLWTLALCYAILSLFNLYECYQQKHWLFWTILLLGLCDICVALQYMTHISIRLIWLFYLPSQVYFAYQINHIEK